jgi:hypothetical protein
MSRQTPDPEPPPNVDATDLAILGDDEVPFNFETNETSEQNEVSQADVDINDQIVNVQNNKETLYEVAKILRKKYTSGKMVLPCKMAEF